MQTFNNPPTGSLKNNTLTVDELIRHYPWFSREEIAEAINHFAERRDKVLAYLDMKSGHWFYFDMLD